MALGTARRCLHGRVMPRFASTAATGVVLVLGGLLAGCGGGPSADDLATVDYAPQAGEGWTVSTPAEHDLDPDAVAGLVRAAIAEDLMGGVDVTSVATIPAAKARAIGVWIMTAARR